jgi:hypothetical protein
MAGRRDMVFRYPSVTRANLAGKSRNPIRRKSLNLLARPEGFAGHSRNQLILNVFSATRLTATYHLHGPMSMGRNGGQCLSLKFKAAKYSSPCGRLLVSRESPSFHNLDRVQGDGVQRRCNDLPVPVLR